ncbi:MAG: hypothetical protein E7360_04900 [Clostridiales bacterium]|nr:hypothetical protein [Clostridiales bacterium]
MEKFGLFDLIDKFNASANGKNDFAKAPQTEKNDGAVSSLVDPKITAPPQYLMNAKLFDFCKKHDELSKRIYLSSIKKS